MLQRGFYHLEIFRESHHGLSGIPFGQTRDEVRVSEAEMTFDPIIHPGQAKNLNSREQLELLAWQSNLPWKSTSPGSTSTRPPKPASIKEPARTTLA
jgi:hypothetical protein